jgi:uncharacterized protein (DUF58 family)
VKQGWRPTQAQLRALVLGGMLTALAVMFRRPDAAVLGLPFAVLAVWGALTRPRGRPQATLSTDSAALLEGQATTVRVALHEQDGTPAERVDLVTVVLPRGRWFGFDPPSGAQVSLAADAAIVLRSRRWGIHPLERLQVVATSRLGAYRADVPPPERLMLTTLPLREGFAAVEAVPRPAGTVGLHRSRRSGDGTEIAGVRPFQTGDRLRRVNWRVSARTRELHVTTTVSERDTEVVLLLDTADEAGSSEGIDGRSSSLDIAVRAAAAIAEHYLRNGDRVRLVDTGGAIREVRAGSGRAHLRRILDALVRAEPQSGHDAGTLAARHRIRPGSLVVVLSPLLRPPVFGAVVSLVHAGCTVIAVDTLPDDVGVPADEDDDWAWPLAWRLRLTERRGEIERLGDVGVPTVRWRGSGTLDEVLRDASRMSAMPRMRT